jgi:RND family efflux transporter MFP subunit
MKSISFVIALAFTLSACNKESAPPLKTERPALTQLVGAQAGESSYVYSGDVRARHEVALAFRTGGKLIERLVESGAMVKAGQVLARLDPADASLQAGSAGAQFQLAEAEAARYRELRQKGFVSQSALDAKEAALKSAAAQSGLARNQADYTTLRAEHDGVVAATLAEVGQVVSSGQAVLRLAQTGEIEVAIEIPEAQLFMRHVGDTAEVVLLTGDGQPMTGFLRELSPVADSLSRSYAARVAFSAAPKLAALGMTARVNFKNSPSTKSAKTAQLLIPLSAIYQQGKQTAVWIVAADHSVSLRTVKIVTFRDDGAVIASGLTAGERIVSAGVHRLSSGEKIHSIQDVIENGNAP